jgi:hypothetical protein
LCISNPGEFLKKSPQNLAQSIFGQNLCISFSVEKSSPTTWATFVVIKNLPKVLKGKNSPNLVTLYLGTDYMYGRH